MEPGNVYERYGLGGNPFQQQANHRLNQISESHVDLALDNEISNIKKDVFDRKQNAIVLLVGKQGMGKTERILVATKEAEMNDLFHITINYSEHDNCAMKQFLDQLSPKGSALLSNDKWEREISKLKKTIEKGYDPQFIGKIFTDALQKKLPAFILIDDIDHIDHCRDATQFLQALAVANQSISSGLFLLMTCETKKASQMMKKYPLLKAIVTRGFEIAPLPNTAAWEVMVKKIETSRVVSDISKGYPFTHTGVTHLNTLAKGNPQKMFDAANVVLTAAAYQKMYFIAEEFQKETFRQLSAQPWFNPDTFHIQEEMIPLSDEPKELSKEKPSRFGKRKKPGKESLTTQKKKLLKRNIVSPNTKDNGSKLHLISSYQHASSTAGKNKQYKNLSINSDIGNNQSHIPSNNIMQPSSIESDLNSEVISDSDMTSTTITKISSDKKVKTITNKKKIDDVPLPILNNEKEKNHKHTRPMRKDSNDDMEKPKKEIKARCPECSKVFSFFIDDKNKSLKCPHCGFTGGY